jgi:hypothetical protein
MYERRYEGASRENMGRERKKRKSNRERKGERERREPAIERYAVRYLDIASIDINLLQK